MKIININTCLFAIVLGLSSCGSDFLEVQPKGSIIASRVSEYENMMYNLLNNGFDAPSVAMGDEVVMLNSYVEASPLRTQRLFRWEATIYEPEQSASEISTPLAAMYIYNKIINEVMQSQGTEEAKKAVQAEAKAARAYHNMMLVNYYGKPYNAATAATDLGFPLVTAADVTQSNFHRATVKEVYDNMISDLTESIPFIPIEVPHRMRMCRAAAEFTLAKVYWFMGDYEKALNWIESGKQHFPTSFANRIYDYNQTYASGSWTVSSGYNNEQSLFAKNSNCSWATASNDILLAPWANALYSANDQRLKSFSTVPNQAPGTTFPVAGIKRRIGPFATQVPQGVYLPDVELMKAECQARAGEVEEATITLVKFREKRMPVAEAAVTNMNQDDLVKFIIEERVREFALYGWRWFDIRRLSNDPLFSTVEYEHIIYSAQTGQPIETFRLTSDRLTLRIPPNVILMNPDMPNNP